MKMYKILSVFFFCMVNFSFSQDDTAQANMFEGGLNFHLIDVSSGLSHNFVNDIRQDSLGFIWIATFDGLNRYDGTDFIQFKEHFDPDRPGLSNNYIQQLKLLNSSELLIATDKGLDIYDFREESFRIIDDKEGLFNNSVSSIGFTPDGKTLIGTYRGGVQIADDNWVLRALPGQGKLSSNEISSFATQGDSILWVGTYNGGLNKVDYSTQKITPIPYGEGTGFPAASINKLYVDRQHNLWVGSRKGIQVITKQGDTLQLSGSSSPATGLSDNDILCFAEDETGHMWIGTRNGGLNILRISSLLNPDKRLDIKWFLPRTDGQSVYNRTVSAIMSDRDRNMWLGTPTGINYVNPGGEPVKLIRQHIAVKGTISHDRIGALERSGKHRMWIGTDGGGLDLYDPQKGVVLHHEHQKNDPNSISNDYILSMLEDSKKRLWAGTYRGGLNRIDIKTGNVTHYLEGSPSDGSDVRVIFESGKGDIWVGTNRGGLYKYISHDDTFLYIESLNKIDIRDMDEDDRGNLWLATYGSGIIEYDPVNNTSTYFDQENTLGLTSNILFSLEILGKNDILCGTRYGGLIRLNPEERSIRSFTEKDGLSNNTVCSLVKENDTYVWMGTYHGISRYNVNTDEILDITALNNIQNGEFNIGAAARDGSGILFFGGNNGLNVLKPDDFKDPKEHSPLIFKELKILNEKVEVAGEKKAVLHQSIPYQKEIVLKHNQNSFSVEFAALKYPVAKNVSYSYKLESYNDFWFNARGMGVANFTKVPPGDYILKVKTNSGLGRETYQELQITIVPPFWKTWPAYLLYIAVATVLTWLIVRYYSERVHLKNSLLFEKKQRQLEHDLNEERLRFFTAFSHELKTPLTLILAPVENLISRERNRELKEKLLFIRKNAGSLLRSINKLLEFRKSEEGLSTLNISRHNLPRNLRKWIENYLPLANGKNISLKYTIPEEKKLFWVDLEKIEVIFNNLLSNAVKYCKKGGEVHVGLSFDGDGFRIEVSDTGKGIGEGEISQIFNWYYRSGSKVRKSGTGIGLALSKRFAELHKGTIEVESIPNEKTIFTLYIPGGQGSAYAGTEAVEKAAVEEDRPFLLDAGPVGTGKKQQMASISSAPHRQVILIIDDNADILYFLNDIFKDEFDVLHASDGVEGLQKAFKYVPDLIISDVMMPEKDGIDLCSNLKKQNSTSHIPIILLTAKSNVESIASGYEEGADDYITKPFHPQLLITRVRNLLNSRLLLREYFLNKGTEASAEITVKETHLLTREKKFLRQLDAIILVHIRSESDHVDIIAQEVGMSRTSLYRKLKAITGLSINQYIRNLKIERAAGLIRDENFSVSQASYEVGFNNIKYFRKVFKEKYGKTPSEFK